MAKFFWNGVDMFGSNHSGYLYATTEKELDAKLLDQEIALISFKQVRSWQRATLSDGERANLYKNLSRLLDAGVLLPDALQSIAESADNVKIHDMIQDVAVQIKQGVSLREALKNIRYLLQQQCCMSLRQESNQENFLLPVMQLQHIAFKLKQLKKRFARHYLCPV